MKFTHLHVHSHYSLLDGLAKIDQILDACQELKMPSIALTDHGSTYGLVEFFIKAKKRGVKPILGVEAYLTPNSRHEKRPNIDNQRFHLILLVKDKIGYQNLVKLVTKSYLEGFYYKPRIDKELLKKHSQGLIGTSACLAGEIPRAITNGKPDQAEKLALEYQKIFGPDNFYLEIQHHPGIPEQDPANQEIIKIAKKHQIPLIATNDCHYVKPEDSQAQDVLMSIQTDKKVDDQERLSMKVDDFSIRSQEQMIQDFKDTPEAIANTQKIVDQCNFEFKLGEYQLPHFEVPNGLSDEEYLKKLCDQGIKERYGDNPENKKEIQERLKYELKVIQTTGFASYFLIVQDFINWAKSQGVGTGPGRGSAAGSIVAYLIGITEIDPLKYDLLFERFLNPERISMPDIDLDFADDRRDEVIHYVAKKYGNDHVAQIITFGTMAARAAIRDVGRAMDYSYTFCDQTAKMIPFGMNLEEAINDSPELHQAYESDENTKTLIDMAKKMEGVARHASTHAAAVVITKDPLDKLVPTQHPTQNDEAIVTQYEMHAIEDLGLLKMDFLGLRTLTVMQNTVNLVTKNHNQYIDFNKLPLNDKETFKLLRAGDTTGVFQLESQGMKKNLKQLKPNVFEDIIAMVALYRPGPMEFIPEFIARKHGEQKIEYLHPKLEPILNDTYGVCITGDSLIQEMNPGGVTQIDNIVNSDKKTYVQSWDGTKFIKQKVTKKFKNGIKNVYKITLRTGKRIETTEDHQFLTPDGWKKLKNLNKNDFIATPKKLAAGAKTFNKNKLKILAYLIADGALSNHNACYFINKNKKLLKDFKYSAEKGFKNIKITFSKHIRNVQRANPSKKEIKKYHQPNDILQWLRELGLKDKKGGKKANNKFIPNFIFELNNNHISTFLAAFWDSDGGIAPNYAYLISISSKLIYQIQTLLLKLGINGCIYKVEKYKGRNDQIVQTYRIIIYDLKQFYNQIGCLMISGKEKNLSNHPKKNYKENNFVPRKPFLEKLLAYQIKNNLSQRKLCELFNLSRKNLFGLKEKQRTRLNIEVARKIAKIVQNDDLKAFCDKKDIRWEDIISIELIGRKNVYDLEIKGTHNFIANNIIVHNCIYQEQLMQIARDLAGFSLAEADVLRKAVGKKIKKLLDEQKEKMIDGMVKNKIEKRLAKKIWQTIEPFAQYGFNKAHSACYGMIGYQTAYLKAHYPTEFMAATMASEQNDIERIAFLVAETRKMDIQVLPPDINESDKDFAPSKNMVIRFGLNAIKNVGHNVVSAIVDERKANGKYINISNFIERVQSKDLNKKSLESLIKCGAMDQFGERNQLLTAMDQMLNLARETQKAKNNGQFSLFADQPNNSVDFKLPQVPPAEKKECLTWEKELLGLYVSEHPLEQYREKFEQATLSIKNISHNHIGKRIRLGGLVSKIQKFTTKHGQLMLFVELEDLTGKTEILVFPNTLEQTAAAWQEDKIIMVNGRLSDRFDNLKILCDSVKIIE